MLICVPITANSNEAALTDMKRGFSLANILELRIDYIRNVDLEKLIQPKCGKIIITNRRADEGGKFQGSEIKRVNFLKDAIALGADYIDIEVSTEKTLIRELIKKITDHGCLTKLIVSYHDFKGTPSEHTLNKKCAGCAGAGADIVKIATYANTAEDNLKIFNLLARNTRQGAPPTIAFCMGKPGRISRIISPFLGSYLTFASLEEGAESAPGQITIQKMKKIFRIIKT